MSYCQYWIDPTGVPYDVESRSSKDYGYGHYEAACYLAQDKYGRKCKDPKNDLEAQTFLLNKGWIRLSGDYLQFNSWSSLQVIRKGFIEIDKIGGLSEKFIFYMNGKEFHVTKKMLKSSEVNQEGIVYWSDRTKYSSININKKVIAWIQNNCLFAKN